MRALEATILRKLRQMRALALTTPCKLLQMRALATTILGPQPPSLDLIIALGLLTVPAFCRVARANTITFAEREFVQAARALGERDVNILMREIMPNVLTPMIVYALLVVAVLIVIEGTLSFLGLGVPSPTPSWGGMIAEGREVLDESPHVSMIPSFVRP